MIHLIYIYFIINAFLVGKRIDWRESNKEIVLLFLFGGLFYFAVILAGIVKGLYLLLDRKTGVHGYYMYLFTNDFECLNKDQIEAITLIFNNQKTSWSVKHIIRVVDKKYGYGITKGDPKP